MITGKGGDVKIIRYRGEFNSTFEGADLQVNKICCLLSSEGYYPNKRLIFLINYIIRELFNNAVEHGNKFELSKLVKYQIEYSKTKFYIEVSDEGTGVFINKLDTSDECLIRHRKRGFESLRNLGVEIIVKENSILATLPIVQDLDTMRREFEMINFTLIDDILICKVYKNLTSVNVKDLILNIKNELETYADYKELIIDLEESKNIDSMGITLIIGVYKTVKTSGKSFKLIGVSDPMLHLFQSLKFNEIFEIEKLTER